MPARISLAALISIATFLMADGTATAQTTIDVNAGQTLTHSDLIAGSFDGTNFTLSPTTTFEINAGGTIGPIGEFNTSAPNVSIELKGATVNLNSGALSGDATSGIPSIVSNGTINVFQGATILPTVVKVGNFNILANYEANVGSTFNFFGGVIRGSYDAKSGSTTNLYGGYFYHTPEFFGDSVINIAGGEFRAMPLTYSSSNITLTGGEFKLNGVPLPAADQTLGSPVSLLSGTFADGTPFLFTRFNSNAQVSLNVVDLPAAAPSPIVVDSANGFDGAGLRSGQSMKLLSGGAIGAPHVVDGETLPRRFTVDGATLSIEGGEVDAFVLDVVHSSMNISQGNIASTTNAFAGSNLDISGGTVAGMSLNGSSLQISGGSVASFNADIGSIVNITGGAVGPGSRVGAGSTANISGGLIETGVGLNPAFGADWGSTLNLFVRGGTIDGEPIDFGATHTSIITNRNNEHLQVVLADGSPFELTLYQHPKEVYGISEGATLQVTLVPEPVTLKLLFIIATFAGITRWSVRAEMSAN